MTEEEKRLNNLESSLYALSVKQRELADKISKLKREIHDFRSSRKASSASSDQKGIATAGQATKKEALPYLERKGKVHEVKQEFSPSTLGKKKLDYKFPDLGIDLEKFIGENLLSKIGVLVLIIGVAIGAKYSIENDLISPLTRIVLGYITGIILLGVGMKLRSKYENYSAVLVSGAMTILYFITFISYSFYDLMPQLMAFGLMVIFTIFTVVAALVYNRQVIAIIGLVGAYAVPILLSSGSGDYKTLFTYIAIVNAGILVLSFKKNWKPLYYTSFVITCMIFFRWLFWENRSSDFYNIGYVFAALYFTSFYLMFLAFKLINKEKYNRLDVLMLLLNSFLFYGAGFTLLSGSGSGKDLLGIFTVANALIHFIVSVILYRKDLADRSLFYLISGLVLVFITIAIPVQLDGNSVTLLWIGLATLLFWIGRTKQISAYERLAYPIIVLALGSLAGDWGSAYNRYYSYGSEQEVLRPLINVQFLASILFSACMAFLAYLNFNFKSALSFKWKWIANFLKYAIPMSFLVVLYQSFQLEIFNYWNQILQGSAREIPVEGENYTNRVMNYDYRNLQSIWSINYTLLFTSLLALFCLKFVNTKIVRWICMGLIVIGLFSFLTEGVFSFSELRQSYLDREKDQIFDHGLVNLWMRYVSYLFVGFALWVLYRSVQSGDSKKDLRIPFDILLHAIVIWILSSEIIHFMDLSSSTQSDKLGLSIFWGIYALGLIAYGIWKGKKHLRIGAIVLFALTLLKLFLYDISHLDTISKTIVFVSLGVLLLAISFLYNKYKHLIVDE